MTPSSSHARHSSFAALALLVALAALVVIPGAHAAPGDLDSSFGTGGKIVSDFGPSAQAVAVQPDGKIVVAVGGSFVFGVARYNRDGTPDTSFSDDGRASIDFGPGGRFALAIAIQVDGKIVAAGNASPDGFCCVFALARFNANGSLDATFDGDGRVTTSFGGFSTALDLVIQPDGRIVAAGSTFSPFGSGFALARYNADGSLDAAFDGDGKLTTDFGGSSGAGGVVLQPDGKIVAAGSGGPGFDFALARYNSDGSLDGSFDGDGKQTTDFALPGAPSPSFDSIGNIVLQPDGRIVAAGTGRERFALARYNADGSLDTSFDGDGKVSTQFLGLNIESAFGVALQSNGKLVAAGRAFTTSDGDFALARYHPDGSLDPSFGGDGLVTTDFGETTDGGRLCPSGQPTCSGDAAADVAIQANGAIVAVGGAGPCIPSCYTVLARYEGDLSDSTPPVLTVPSGLAVDATTPNGAVVSYAASATDDVDGSVPVTCLPASGSTFAIGTTSVTCSAEDAAGNDASATFDVHVKGASEQIDDLHDFVADTGPGTSLRRLVEAAQQALARENRQAACGILAALANEAEAQLGKMLTAGQATELVTAATRIRAVLDC